VVTSSVIVEPNVVDGTPRTRYGRETTAEAVSRAEVGLPPSKMNGTVRIRTSDAENRGSLGSSSTLA
jgi:hypothetical protein